MMFYDPRDNLRPDPLQHNPFNTLIAPRPIGWISTVSGDGIYNLAPFSYFNAISADPPMVMFAPHGKGPDTSKDTFRNLTEVGEFVVNIVSADLKSAMNQTSGNYPHEIDEFEAVGLQAVPAVNVRPHRVKAAKAALECTVFDTMTLPPAHNGRQNNLVIGEVVGIHLDDNLITPDGGVDQLALAQVARLGRSDYLTVERIFDMRRPD
jgi:flavin reductase (DIM6/NTAB) family NADH-FMN oxidoreductase RutF